jgi:ferrous iron transport protein A
MIKKLMNSYPLTLARENQPVRVVDVTGGKNLLRRLLAMGISDNTELIVLRRHSGLEGGMVVRCGESRWALGTGMAHKILVTDSDTAIGA